MWVGQNLGFAGGIWYGYYSSPCYLQVDSVKTVGHSAGVCWKTGAQISQVLVFYCARTKSLFVLLQQWSKKLNTSRLTPVSKVMVTALCGLDNAGLAIHGRTRPDYLNSLGRLQMCHGTNKKQISHYRSRPLIYGSKSAQNCPLANIPETLHQTPQRRKDIDGLIEVLQIPLYAAEVVPQLVGGPVDFFPCCCRGALKELRPSLKQSLGSVDCFLYLSVVKVKGKKGEVTHNSFYELQNKRAELKATPPHVTLTTPSHCHPHHPEQGPNTQTGYFVPSRCRINWPLLKQL